MSTKVGISDGKNYYLYRECFESFGDIYLRLEDAKINVDSDNQSGKVRATVKIEIETWRAIVSGWLSSSWEAHPEWDGTDPDGGYDQEALIRFLESKAEHKKDEEG